jgi:hypothetical protein
VIYELRHYSVKYGEQDEYFENFKEYIVPHLAESGFKLIGAWMTYIGEGVRSEFMWILEWTDLAEREACNGKLHSYPWWDEFAEKGASHISDAQISFMAPLDFSPLQ